VSAAAPFAKGADHLTAAIAVTPFKESDFVIDCDGCTACCRGDDGPIINPGEVSDYDCHQDDKGQWRLDQTEEGQCVYLSKGSDEAPAGCMLHFMVDATESYGDRVDEALPPPRICRDFDCRAVIVKFTNRGLDYMVNSGQLPLEVVIEGRRQLKKWNDMINTRALAGGADLSGLLMTPGKENSDGEVSQKADSN
jgi:hypothetical protein